MVAEPGRGPRLPATFRSPERHWRTTAYAALALLAAWYFAIRYGSASGVVAGSVLGVVLLAAAWRVHRARLVADARGLTDYRAIRTVRVSWTDITGFDVARPAGPWSGFCVRAIRHAGEPVDLLAARGYSLLPSRSSYNEVHRLMWTLDGRRPAAQD